MLDLEKNCRVAVVQCSPVMFDKDATLAKCIDLIKQAFNNQLIRWPCLATNTCRRVIFLVIIFNRIRHIRSVYPLYGRLHCPWRHIWSECEIRKSGRATQRSRLC